MKSVVSDCLGHQPKDVCAEGIPKFVYRRETFLTVLGDYLEKKRMLVSLLEALVRKMTLFIE